MQLSVESGHSQGGGSRVYRPADRFSDASLNARAIEVECADGDF
jgi:hypothetical protein